MNIVCLYRYRDIQGIHLPCSLTYTKQIGKNTKKHSANYIESNQIGLKSVQQMIKIHDGTFTVLDEESTFTVSITIPLMQ